VLASAPALSAELLVDRGKVVNVTPRTPFMIYPASASSESALPEPSLSVDLRHLSSKHLLLQPQNTMKVEASNSVSWTSSLIWFFQVSKIFLRSSICACLQNFTTEVLAVLKIYIDFI